MRDRNGAETWLVVVKATWEVADDGSLSIAQEQPEPRRAPEFRGEPETTALVYDNDFVLEKRATDVVVNGTAYAPKATPVRELDVGVHVGPVQKVLRVFGDRAWVAGGQRTTRPLPFDKMPIEYERAYGGVDAASPNPQVDFSPANPVGVGFIADGARADGVRVPNFEYPVQLVTSWKSRPPPAGFGFMGQSWSQRSQYAGTYDDAWSKTRMPLLPSDFDGRYFQSVPQDQQAPGFLRGGEPVALHNLTPSGALRFYLPIMNLSLETRFQDGDRVLHPPPLLHTVILEPDLKRVSLCWHSAMMFHPRVYQLEHTRVTVRLPGQTEDDEVVESLLDLV